MEVDRPIFGDCDPRTITPEQLIGDASKPHAVGLRPLMATKVSERDAHRVIKPWARAVEENGSVWLLQWGRRPGTLFRQSGTPAKTNGARAKSSGW